jgi:phage gp46-like protein
MSQDLQFAKNSDGLIDLVLDGAKFAAVDGLETAIQVSLLTDARVPESTVITPSLRRGWVGNILNADTGRQIGSRLWIFDQSRITQEILNDMVLASEEALAWMVEDLVAKSVSASVVRRDARSVDIIILIMTIEGKQKQYSILWRSTGVI